jgi:hypothetical protein
MTVATVTATKVRPLDGCRTRAFDAGEALDVGDVIQVDGSGDAVAANATTKAGATGTLGIVVAGSRKQRDGSIASGERVTCVMFGPVTGFTDLDETKTYWVAKTDGKMDDTAPTSGYQRPIGSPESSTVFFFNPSGDDPDSA